MPDTTRTASPTYDGDFYAWALHQAALLREVRRWQPNVPLDLEHLVEEVEDLASNSRATVRSQVRRLFENFLKLEFSPATDPRRRWEESVHNARVELDERLTATLEQTIREELPEIYEKARRYTTRDLRRYGEANAAERLPATCPYTWEQLRDEDWFPEAKP
jgi:hypothetical protein